MADLTCGMIRKSLIFGDEKQEPEGKKAEGICVQQCMENAAPCMAGRQQTMGSMRPGMGNRPMQTENQRPGMGNRPMQMENQQQTMGNMPMRMGNQPSMSGLQPCVVDGMQNLSSEQARCMLRKQVDEFSFAMDDAHLFLDTHPDHAEAFRYFKDAVSRRQNAVNAYERQFGPLMVEDAAGDTWNWVTEKWPWEGGC